MVYHIWYLFNLTQHVYQVEILRSESLSKDRSLAEEVRMGTAAHYARDSLRIEHNRCNNILRDKKEMV